MWIDTHAHLNDDGFSTNLNQVLERALAAGVETTLVIGIDRVSSQRAVELAQLHDSLFAVVGIQPNSLGKVEPDDWQAIVELATQPKVVALGETGLDRYWDLAPLDRQMEYFDRHLELASARQLPVVIHCREAETDVVAQLRAFAHRQGNPAIAGVMHSFTGDIHTARQCLELGLHISFAGMVTFKKNDALRAVASTIPLDRLLVETDSPYLAPHPHRGKSNEPALVVHTGACLAGLHQRTPVEFAAITTANARRLFHLPAPS